MAGHYIKHINYHDTKDINYAMATCHADNSIMIIDIHGQTDGLGFLYTYKRVITTIYLRHLARKLRNMYGCTKRKL